MRIFGRKYKPGSVVSGGVISRNERKYYIMEDNGLWKLLGDESSVANRNNSFNKSTSGKISYRSSILKGLLIIGCITLVFLLFVIWSVNKSIQDTNKQVHRFLFS